MEYRINEVDRRVKKIEKLLTKDKEVKKDVEEKDTENAGEEQQKAEYGGIRMAVYWLAGAVFFAVVELIVPWAYFDLVCFGSSYYHILFYGSRQWIVSRIFLRDIISCTSCIN